LLKDGIKKATEYVDGIEIKKLLGKN